MNKALVKRLAEQAGYELDMFGFGHWDSPMCQRFAELIVKECINLDFREIGLSGLSCFDVKNHIRHHFQYERPN